MNKLKYLFYFLLVFYVACLAASLIQIDNLITYSQEKLDSAKRSLDSIRGRLNELPNIVPALLSSANLNYRDTEIELERQSADRDKILNSIRENYPGDARLVEGLLEGFTQYRKALKSVAARLESNGDFEQAVTVFNQELMPYLRANIGYVNRLDVNLAEMFSDVNAKIRFRMHLLITISVVYGVFLLIIYFVTERRDAAQSRELIHREKLLNQLSHNVDEVFIIAEGRDKFVYVSPNIEKLLGLSQEMTQNSPECFYSFLPTEKLKAAMQGVLAGGLGQTLDENLAVPELGKSFRLRVYPIADASAAEERHIISLSDQTASILHQEALGIALKNAHAASAAKSSFLSHMSHEIRTPMNAIIGIATIASSKLADTARVKDCLCKILESSRHLLGLINDILDMSKIESGKFSIHNEPFNLYQNIAHIRNIGQVQAESKKLSFEVNLENIEEDALIGDSLRLNQVLLNLLSNAWKFTPAGGKTSLTARQVSLQNNVARFIFVVQDNGIGMSQEFLARLYEPFEQASAAVSGKFGGTGLGMPITANIVALMGGTIQVESEEGKGTKFTLELAFGVDTANNEYRNALPAMKILVVDDDADSCEHACLLLTKMGLQADYALSGTQALEMIGKTQGTADDFSGCIVDWKMPDQDGLETARAIHELKGDGFALLLSSAYDYSQVVEDAHKCGILEFIAKPFFSSTLYNALMSATHKTSGVSLKTPEKKQRDFSGKRFLLAEDNEFNAEIAQEFLEMAKAEVELAANGQEAVEKFLNSEPGYYDLILMDVQMPVMNGHDAARKIRGSDHPQAKSIAILAMTANAFVEDVAKALASGMNDHIAKPIDVNELYEKLACHLEKGAQDNFQAS